MAASPARLSKAARRVIEVMALLQTIEKNAILIRRLSL